MDRGDIFWVPLDPATDHEQRGTRPVVVVSPAAFNKVTRTPVVLPITNGGEFARTRGFVVSLEDAGTQTTGIVRCDQPLALDLRACNSKFVEAMPTAVIEDIMARLVTLFE